MRPAGFQRVVIDVGGTKITTTVATIERSSYLSGMIDCSCWESDPEHVAEVFIDRDPEIFSMLLRLMRQTPHIAGLLPTDPRACASLIAEADFFGFEALLAHVKTFAYYNSREAKEDYPVFDLDIITTRAEETEADFRLRRREGRNAHSAACRAIDKLFANRDAAHAQAGFDKIYGSIGDALSKGVLPAYFINGKPPKVKPFTKILQLMPVDETTWFLVGDTCDRRADPEPDEDPDGSREMLPLVTVFSQPALVRRVSCYALVENETGKRWVEAMIHVAIEDQQAWISGRPFQEAYLGVTVEGTLPNYTENVGQRTVLASYWVANYVNANRLWGVNEDDVWSHVLVADTPPEQYGFQKSGPF